MTSQVPYMETDIGPPYVYTVDISNISVVEETIRNIKTSKV